MQKYMCKTDSLSPNAHPNVLPVLLCRAGWDRKKKLKTKPVFLVFYASQEGLLVDFRKVLGTFQMVDQLNKLNQAGRPV